jgi:predicted P-loop ATPase
MKYDRQITISTAGSRKATLWPPSTLMWSEMVERLAVPHRSTETLAEYLGYKKGKQDSLKDVGGFVAGTLIGNRRKANAAAGRDVVTLDIDNIPAGGTADMLRRVDALGCGYAIYSTRKHHEAAPRLRVLIPLSRTVSADEYEPIGRKLASLIDPAMGVCDATTFQAIRLRYWPSVSSDSQYIYTYGDKPFADADGILGMYADWHDVTGWPEVPGAPEARKRIADKQEDPTAKNGVIGAFCKIYDVYRSIDELIPGVYEPCDTADNRLTFTGGSTTGGAVVYDNGKFLFSHHATDPAGGQLCNAFDLVRLHKFASLDDDAKPDTPTNKLPSYTAMCKFAVADAYVAQLMAQERYEKATSDFSSPVDDNTNWMTKLSTSPTTGEIQKTIDNILIILENDPLLRGKIGYDEFSNRGIALGALPWNAQDTHREWSDTDDKGLRRYLELVYNIFAVNKTDDALGLAAHNHTLNEVADYLASLTWDGVPRLDSLIIDYLGAKDDIYVRTVTRKAFTAAVARAMQPGIKFDWVTILVGPQGVGKSTLLRLMGRRWYSDSLTSFEGKEASEMIQGVWINELGELSSLSRSETNIAKQFISRTDDIYREPFGKRTNRFPRRGVFFGTSNESDFLRDPTGERRFWPITIAEFEPMKNVFTELADEVDQIWAEAYVRWQIGETLYLPKEIEELARQQQEAYRESNAKEGIIADFLSRKLPLDWNRRTVAERRVYWSCEFKPNNDQGELERDRVCAAEIWCECFNSDIKYLNQKEARDINAILSRLRGWKRYRGRFGAYGHQKGFEKVLTNYGDRCVDDTLFC